MINITCYSAVNDAKPNDGFITWRHNITIPASTNCGKVQKMRTFLFRCKLLIIPLIINYSSIFTILTINDVDYNIVKVARERIRV